MSGMATPPTRTRYKVPDRVPRTDRGFLPFVFLLSLLVLAAWRLSAPSPARAASERTFELTYQVVLPEIPRKAETLWLWVPLATSNPNQQILSRSIQSELPYRITRDPDYGNDILFLRLGAPFPESIDLAVRYQARVKERAYLEEPAVEVSALGKEDRAFYLRSANLMVIDDRVRSLAREVTAGARTPLEKARAIYDYVIGHMAYDKQTPGWGRGDTLRACHVGKGNCTDFHSLFISLARASGVPARFQIGTPLPEGKPQGEISGYHCWAEFYLEGTGWVPVDASEAWKDKSRLDYFFGTYDPNRLALSTGRDIRLTPSASNGPVNIFFYPHAEVDGEPCEGVRAEFRFRDVTTVVKEHGGPSDA